VSSRDDDDDDVAGDCSCEDIIPRRHGAATRRGFAGKGKRKSPPCKHAAPRRSVIGDDCRFTLSAALSWWLADPPRALCVISEKSVASPSPRRSAAFRARTEKHQCQRVFAYSRGCVPKRGIADIGVASVLYDAFVHTRCSNASASKRDSTSVELFSISSYINYRDRSVSTVSPEFRSSTIGVATLLAGSHDGFHILCVSNARARDSPMACQLNETRREIIASFAFGNSSAIARCVAVARSSFWSPPPLFIRITFRFRDHRLPRVGRFAYSRGCNKPIETIDV